MSEEFVDASSEFAPRSVRKTVDGIRGAQKTATNVGNAPDAKKPHIAADGGPTAAIIPSITPTPPPAGQRPTGAFGRVADTEPDALTRAGGYIGYAGLAPVGLLFGPMLVNHAPQWFGYGVRAIGKGVGSKGMEAFGDRRVEAAQKRIDRWDKFSNKPIGDRLGWSQTAGARGGFFDSLGSGVQAIDNKLGFGKWRSNRLSTGMRASAGDAGGMLRGFTQFLGNARVDDAYKSDIEALQGEITRLEQATDRLKSLGEKESLRGHESALQEVTSARDAVVGKMNALHANVRKNPTEWINKDNISETRSGIFKRAAHSVLGIKPATNNDTLLKGVEKHFSRANHFIERSVARSGKAGFWGNLREGFRNFPKKVSALTTSHALMNGGIMASNIGMNLNTKHNIETHVKQFEAIYEGLTGKSCSFWQAMTGDVPPVLKHAQRELFWGALRSGGYDALLDAVDTVLFFRPHAGPVMMGTQMAGMAIKEAFDCQVPLLQVEQAMTESQQKGMQLQPAHYAQLLQLAAPETIGHVKSTNTMLIRLCNDIAKQQWTPLKVLQAVNDNTINRMASHIEKELAAQGRKPRESLPEAPEEKPAVKAAEKTAQEVAVPAPANINTPMPANNNTSSAESTAKAAISATPLKQIQLANATHIAPTGLMAARA